MKVNQIELPPQTSGEALRIEGSPRSVVIVGANGAGKSRFASKVASELGDKAFMLSALSAIYDRSNSSQPHSAIDRIYRNRAADGMLEGDQQNTTQFERLMRLLIHDEMVNLLDFKLQHSDNPEAELGRTNLDEVIALWQEIFPDNRVLIEGGRMLFTRRPDREDYDTDSYSALKLSTGEKAVIYYLGAITYAPKRSVVFVDSPEMFLHPTMMQSVWNRIEMLRPDCTFIYTTHDLSFASSRTGAPVVWVRSYDARSETWDYAILPAGTEISSEIYSAILGARKPVLFIEGDANHSIDGKLYSLIFKDFTVQPLGSCNKVIEATRSFNDLNAFHQLDSYGIVDRDRRDENEVEYLRRKRVMVPEVAEVENILMLEDVIRAVAHYCGKNEDRVFNHVKKGLIGQFGNDVKQQALLHTRHRVKRMVECRIDGRFSSVDMLEKHITGLMGEINPRGLYKSFLHEFNGYRAEGDYDSILRVYNQKSMLSSCNVAGLCGLDNKEQYITKILTMLRLGGPDADRVTRAVRRCFNLGESIVKTKNGKRKR